MTGTTFPFVGNLNRRLPSFPTANGRGIAVYAFDAVLCHGLRANQNADAVAILRIDRASGTLSDNGRRLEAGTPMCVKFLAA